MAPAWSSYRGIVKEIEDQFCDLSGSDSKGTAKHDRATGTSHVMKSVMTEVCKDGHNTNPNIRARRLDSRWRTAMSTSRDPKSRQRALWKLIHHERQVEVNGPQLSDANAEGQAYCR